MQGEVWTYMKGELGKLLIILGGVLVLKLKIKDNNMTNEKSDMGSESE